MWTSQEALKCACGALYQSRGDQHLTIQAARVAGWHINVEEAWREDATICPRCINTPRPRLTRSAPLPGAEPLFEMEFPSERRIDPDHN